MELEEVETTDLNHISIIDHNLYLHKVLIQTQKMSNMEFHKALS